ncbi:hypothetical protein TraAM80_04767 [Trypanosoma rangeli]|uniref:Suppressor of forked domain-containing protein n=1 Tax=Trypanosoma rangeli TaxID=5698 RepID=A0A422NHV7_TRYRA|nr:uncharacterized protein TraAM80_04767 [Trypanosoma rangeli]RNF05047.1 hypothetical protein TraAM80_04767 [Trypanosoma rangeli]|eukprot:RNF05047.1 hypothetical protein TraAM80_04767 [Trypanosoma rangeli]
MEEDNLLDLMNRLRFITGKSVEAPMPEATATCISEQCRLVIQQALFRHPALVMLHKTRDELKKHVMDQLQDSLQTEAAISDDVGRLLGWINETSESLELERLSAVYSDTEEVYHHMKRHTLEELGIETLPKQLQCAAGDLSPWNVLFALVVGPLLTFDETRYKRVEMYFPNPTPSMVTDLMEINKNVYSTPSWVSLLSSLAGFPIKAVRHVWLAALFFFPTSGPLVVAYLTREIAEASKRRFLWEERDEDDAKETYRSYCRVLNCFFRHLPLCFNVELFRLFMDFLERFIRPDDATLDAVFKTALQRYIGHCPASAELWKKYIRWKGDKIRDANVRREWVRKMYIRVLRTPLNGLSEIKEDYDFFLKAEYRGRPPSEGRLEERFVRARGAAGELNRFIGTYSNTHGGDALPRLLYLPRPVRLMANCTSHVVVSEKEEIMRRLEVELWAQWTALIDRESGSSAYMGIELFRYERVRFFLAMRASFFPHQSFSWTSLVDYCLGQQLLLSEAERQALAREALEKASFLLNKNFLLQVSYCDYMLRDLADPECAHRSIKGLLLQQRRSVVDYIKKETLASLETAMIALERVALLAVNWMRWGSLNNEVTNTQHVRLVARFTMHRVDFLSLIMGVIRRASKEERSFSPRRCLRAFNTFCRFWVELELIRNQAQTEALAILERWKDHLNMFCSSAKDREWGLVDCGIDEYFTSSCANVCRSDASAVQQVLGFMEEVRLTATKASSFSPADVESLLETIRGIRDMFFVVNADAGSVPASTLPLRLFSARVRGATIPLQTYDHHLFTAEGAWHEEDKSYVLPSGEVREGEGNAATNPLLAPSVEAMPDDARWVSYAPARAYTATENSRSAQKGNTDQEVKPRKNKRPPNGRSLVVESVCLRDLPTIFHSLGSTAVSDALLLRKVEQMLTTHMPSTHETDVLFQEMTVDTEWLFQFMERMPAMQ